MILNKWVVFFISSEGFREGTEIIKAETKEEAIDVYKRFFNVDGRVVAIRRIESK